MFWKTKQEVSDNTAITTMNRVSVHQLCAGLCLMVLAACVPNTFGQEKPQRESYPKEKASLKTIEEKGIPKSAKPPVAASNKQPNFLFIAVDDLRPELGCYGATQVKSPNIDRLAGQGMVFNRAYCQFAVCGASRASLLTGLRPTPVRFLNFSTYAEKDAPNAMTLPEELRKNGYHTLSNGKVFHHQEDTAGRSWSEPPWRPEIGGLDFLDPESKNLIGGTKNRGPVFEAPDVPDNAYPDGQIADKTIHDLKKLKESGKPFFLACGFMKPHLPFYAPKKYWDLYDREKIVVADNPYKPQNAPRSLKGSEEIHSYHNRNIEYNSDLWHRSCRHGYYACVSYVDAQIGRVLQTLDELGLSDNTFVILWGDHGWHLGEHNFWGKHNVMYNATHAPLILAGPGIESRQSSDALVEFVDIYPSLLDLAGIASENKELQGFSFKSLLNESDRPWKKAAFSKFGPAVSVITDRYNYAEFNNGERMLYDLQKDPAENINIAESTESKEVVKELSAMLNGDWKTALPTAMPDDPEKSSTANAAQFRIDRSWNIAEVPSDFPVRFCLLTSGNRQYVAYYDKQRRMTVASRTLDSEQWQYQVLPSRVGWDSHNYITMAMDGEGQLHVSGNMHVDPLLYFRTEKPGDISTLKKFSMTGEMEERVTYPKFLTDHTGRLVFNYRDGGSGNGMRLYNKYDLKTRSWSRLLNTPLLDGQGQRNAYPSGPVSGPDGWFHIVWVWRETPDCATNHHLSYARSRDLIRWESVFGEDIQLPITLGQEQLWVDPVPSGGGIINGCEKLTFDTDNRPMISYHKADADGNMQIYAARPEGGKWVHHRLTDWNKPIDFEGYGSMGFIGIRISGLSTVEPGVLTMTYRHRDYGSGRLFVDERTLQPLDKPFNVIPEYPDKLHRVQSDFPGMQINHSEDIGGSDDETVRYILVWETLEANHDRPRQSPLPPPSMLRLYKLTEQVRGH